MTDRAKYIIVENAGYEGECEHHKTFTNYWEALDWMNRHYGKGEDSEQERLHVAIRRDDADGTCEYV
jgi:hypothetical protein